MSHEAACTSTEGCQNKGEYMTLSAKIWQTWAAAARRLIVPFELQGSTWTFVLSRPLRSSPTTAVGLHYCGERQMQSQSQVETNRSYIRKSSVAAGVILKLAVTSYAHNRIDNARTIASAGAPNSSLIADALAE